MKKFKFTPTATPLVEVKKKSTRGVWPASPRINGYQEVEMKISNRGPLPKWDIDWELVETLCGMQCTTEEISLAIKVPVDTLRANQKFKMVYQIGWANARISVRRMQFRVAQLEAQEGKRCNMLIHLGRQILGQRDTVKHEHSANPYAMPFNKEKTHDLKNLTVEELEQWQALIKKAALVAEYEDSESNLNGKPN